MSSIPENSPCPSIGIIGLGAFGRLIAKHLAPHAALKVFDRNPITPDRAGADFAICPLDEVARCPIVILAVPVADLADTVDAIAPLLLPGTLVVDVGSVKLLPVEIMTTRLPADVDLLATHPLFGPESAAGGIAGLKIAICLSRGKSALRAAAFLRRVLGLQVIAIDAERHDREMAVVQGLTHLIAQVLRQMEPMPTRMGTKSFELMMQGFGMVRNDAPGVLHAIEHINPFAADVRRRFLSYAASLDGGPAALVPER